MPQDGRGVLYPQLPNIPRKASPPPEHTQTPSSSPIRRPEFLCSSAESLRDVPSEPLVHYSPVSERSSASWSDDSGYFIAGSCTRMSTLTLPPKERITEWLVSVSTPEYETDAGEYTVRDDSCEYLQCPLPQLDSNFSTKHNECSPWSYSDVSKPLLHPQTLAQDPFIQDESNRTALPLLTTRRAPKNFSNITPSPISPGTSPSPVITRPRPSPIPLRSASECSVRDEGGIQLSPLSPNVCVERGPARYHATRALRFKENVGTRPESTSGASSTPLTPCKIGVGTRFQHARHNTYASRRFGSCVER
jgi:hypothetical protein